jgi:type VII secretion integral membrane protein EccD
MSAGLARVTISAPQRRVDVALPEHVPLAELLPEVLRHAGEGLADDGERHGGWLLRRTDGAALATAQGLFPQGIKDGEVLHLVPARADWPELEYDDVVEAIADEARRRGTVWGPPSTRTASLAAAGVLLAIGTIALLLQGPRSSGATFVGLGAALLLTIAATAASRAYGDARAGGALGGYALPYAFVGGAMLIGPDPGPGTPPVAALSWIGGPQLLAGTVAVLLFSALGFAGVAAAVRIFAAGGTVGVLGALTALLGWFIPTAAAAAAVLLCVLVCGIGALPLLAIRFGKMPMPSVTLPTGTDAEQGFAGAGPAALDAARERPGRTVVLAAVTRTEELLAGMLLGHTVLAACAFLVLATSGGMAGRILVAVSSAALLLRSRLFVTVRQRVPLIVGGLIGAATLGLSLLAGADAAMLLALTAGGLALALVTVVSGATYSQRPPSPYLGRAADVLDTLVVVSVIPVACAVLGLYDYVRDVAS